MGDIFLFFLSVMFSWPLSMAQETDFDIIFRNIKLIDGTGAPWSYSDVGVTEGLITKIGSIPEQSTAKSIINGNGSFFLSPGFVDSHTHDDIAVLDEPSHFFKVVQGVTTIVTGNCGFSNFPEGQLEIVQDHLNSLLGANPPEKFFSDFYSLNASLSSAGLGVNVANLVGHGPLRLAVIGYENREATQAEIDQMCQLLRTQLTQGAIGLSLGLVYPPSSYAGIDELVALASVVKSHNRLLSAHIRSYEGGLITSVQELLQVLRQSGARGLLSHLQAAGSPYWNSSIPQALSLLENAREQEGIDVALDMYPYLAGSSTILQLLPPSAMSGGVEELLDNLNDQVYVEYLKNMTEFGSEPGWESKVALIGYGNIVVGSVANINLARFEGLSFVEGATLLGSADEFQFLLYILREDRGMTNVIMHQQSEADNFLVFQSRLQMIGSDSIPRSGGGKPHPRGFGTFPRLIGRYSKQHNLMSLEEAIRKASSLPAARFGIRDRGLIKEGFAADLLLFSEDFLDQATFESPTLAPTGTLGVWVNGVRVVGENGELVGNVLPGKVLSGT